MSGVIGETPPADGPEQGFDPRGFVTAQNTASGCVLCQYVREHGDWLNECKSLILSNCNAT